jgi:hypothetical protein
MLKKILLPFGIILVANYLIKKYMFVEKVNFRIKKIDFNNNIFNPVLVLSIAAINPINTTARINNLISDIFVNNKKVGVARNENLITIAPKSTTVFDLYVSILPITAIASIFDIYKKFGGEVKLSGSVEVDGINFPIDINYSI